MKKILLFSILAGSLLIACKKEDFQNQGKRQSVGFQISAINNQTSRTRGGEEFRMDENLFVNITVEDNNEPVSTSMTKGIPVENEEEFFDNIDLFKVWCWNNTAAVFTNPMVVKKNMDVYMPYSNGNFLEKTFAGVSWTTPKFYALAPSDPTGVTVTTASNSSLVLAYVTPASTGNRKDAENMQDWLVGTFSGSAETDLAKNLVPLTFEHPLARLDFKIGYVGEEITIDSIKLNNIMSKGTYTCTYSSGGYTYAWSSVATRKSYVQEFNTQVTPSTVGSSIVDPVSKSFFVVPYSYTGDDVDTASMIKVYYNSPSLGQRVATLPLRLKRWEAGKTYTYTFHIFNGPWVDYDNIKKLGGNSFTKIACGLNDSIDFTFPQASGSYEKCCIPIRKLASGTWYELDFSEKYSCSISTLWNTVGSYTCGVLSSRPTGTGQGSQITFYTSADGNPERYFWSRVEPTTANTPYTPSRYKILFKATADDMYWVFELSKCNDDANNAFFKFQNYSITPITKPSVPAINFVESTFYNFMTEYNSNTAGHSTFKSYAKYGTEDEDGQLEFHARNNQTYKKLNVPLINLVPGTKYMISFNYQRETQGDNKPTVANGYGYYISETEDSSNSSVVTLPGYVNLSGNITLGTTYTTATVFTATQENMYLVIDLSALQGTRNIVNFTKARITDDVNESQVSAEDLEHKVW